MAEFKRKTDFEHNKISPSQLLKTLFKFVTVQYYNEPMLFYYFLNQSFFWQTMIVNDIKHVFFSVDILIPFILYIPS